MENFDLKEINSVQVQIYLFSMQSKVQENQ